MKNSNLNINKKLKFILKPDNTKMFKGPDVCAPGPAGRCEKT